MMQLTWNGDDVRFVLPPKGYPDWHGSIREHRECHITWHVSACGDGHVASGVCPDRGMARDLVERVIEHEVWRWINVVVPEPDGPAGGDDATGGGRTC